LQRAGEEHRDDRDREQVIDDGQSEQEGAQPGRQVCADDRQHSKGERDVGGGRDRPPRQRVVTGGGGDRKVEQRRHHHTADRGGDRQRGASGIP